LVAVIAQRLVRRLCAACKVPQVLGESECKLLKIKETDGLVAYQKSGCANCHNSGYKGRVALFETLWMDEHLARIIARGGSEKEIRNNAKDFVSLADDCREKILAGHTSIDEFERLSLGYEESIDSEDEVAH
jgi:type II secretory ATPase GspE/PulE/Tfp pilus assembly ATPase PilB-like protein